MSAAMKNMLGIIIICLGIFAILMGLGNCFAWQICVCRTPRLLFHEKAGQIEKDMTREVVVEIMGKPDKMHAAGGIIAMVYNNPKPLSNEKPFEENLAHCVIVITNDIVKDVMRMYR